MFSCEFCEISKNTFLTEHLRWLLPLLGIEIDKDLTFDTHIAKLCSKAAAQLNAISRLNRYSGTSKKAAIINSFTYANFDCYPLIWHFCLCNSSKKIEEILKECYGILLHYYENNCDALLEKVGKSTTDAKRLRTLAI